MQLKARISLSILRSNNELSRAELVNYGVNLNSVDSQTSLRTKQLTKSLHNTQTSKVSEHITNDSKHSRLIQNILIKKLQVTAFKM